MPIVQTVEPEGSSDSSDLDEGGESEGSQPEDGSDGYGDADANDLEVRDEATL